MTAALAPDDLDLIAHHMQRLVDMLNETQIQYMRTEAHDRAFNTRLREAAMRAELLLIAMKEGRSGERI